MSRRRADGHADPPPHGPTSAATAPHYEALFFGTFQVRRDGSRLSAAALNRASARTLLKWFVLQPGTRFEAHELCEILWPGQKPKDTLNRLHMAVHHLRHLLEPELAARQPSLFIRPTANGQYSFDFAGRWRTDVLEAERLLGGGKAAETEGDDAAAIAAYEGVLGYHERTFLAEDLYSEAFDPLRAEYEVSHDTVQSKLLHLYLASGITYKALTCALSMQERNPYSEEAATTLAEISLRLGNPLSARLQLQSYLETVQRELGVAPGTGALRLYERITKPDGTIRLP